MEAPDTPAYIMNALAMDFESNYSMEGSAISEVFQKIESSGLNFFLRSSLCIYIPELKNFYERRVVFEEGKIIMLLG